MPFPSFFSYIHGGKMPKKKRYDANSAPETDAPVEEDAPTADNLLQSLAWCAHIIAGMDPNVQKLLQHFTLEVVKLQRRVDKLEKQLEKLQNEEGSTPETSAPSPPKDEEQEQDSVIKFAPDKQTESTQKDAAKKSSARKSTRKRSGGA